MTYMFIPLFIRHKNKLKIEWIIDFIAKTETWVKLSYFFLLFTCFIRLACFCDDSISCSWCCYCKIFVQLKAFPSYSGNMQKLFWPNSILKKITNLLLLNSPCPQWFDKVKPTTVAMHSYSFKELEHMQNTCWLTFCLFLCSSSFQIISV